MLTLKVHEAPAASVAPARLITLLPAVADTVPPPQEPVSPFGVAIFRGLGNVSEIPMLVFVRVFGLVMVKLKLVIPVWGTVDGVNDLLSVGGAGKTVSVAPTGLAAP